MHSTVLISCLGTEHFLGNFPPRSGICYLGTQTSPKSFQTIVNKSVCCSCSPPSPREIWERKLSKKSLLATFRVKFFLAEPQKWHKNCDIKGVNSVWEPPVCARACPRAPLTLPPGWNSPFPYGTTAFPVRFAPDHSTPCRALKCCRQIFQVPLQDTFPHCPLLQDHSLHGCLAKHRNFISFVWKLFTSIQKISFSVAISLFRFILLFWK